MKRLRVLARGKEGVIEWLMGRYNRASRGGFEIGTRER